MWTNSFCGHPSPGERTVDAVHRRGRQELGLRIDEAVCVLPDFRYRAVAADGAVENEICPVFCAHSDDSVRPAPMRSWTTDGSRGATYDSAPDCLG